MWPFRKVASVVTAAKPAAPDPIGDICRSLAERPWEWTVGRVGSASDNQYQYLRHNSGVVLAIERKWRSHPDTWLGNGDGSIGSLQPRDVCLRIHAAVLAHAAALVSRKPFRFTDSAIALADAIKAGADLNAVYGLIDEILEHHNRPESST